MSVDFGELVIASARATLAAQQQAQAGQPQQPETETVSEIRAASQDAAEKIPQPARTVADPEPDGMYIDPVPSDVPQEEAAFNRAVGQAVIQFEQGKTDEETKAALGDVADIHRVIKDARARFADEVAAARQREDELRKTALEAVDKQVDAEFEAKKQWVANVALKNRWKLPVTREEIEKLYATLQEVQKEQAERELPNIQVPSYPVFPSWVFGGIPAYDSWVKPFCKLNSRYPEFMMLPLMTLILNYMSTKGVRIEYKGFPLSIFMLSVGRKGRVIKSSSAQDAMDFCEKMEILTQVNSQTRNAEGKSLVFTVGSTEGLGAEMSRTNCQSAVLFYDEFSKLIAKMSIENSSFANDLSTTYESGKFSNVTKTRKEHFSFNPGSYCLSLIGCTTDKRYPRLASRLFSAVDGMDERFFVLYQPEVLKDVEPMVSVPVPADVVLETRKMVDQAIQQGVYSIDDSEPLREISKLNNRLEIRAEKWALCFAVLLGKTSVDESCVERGIALSKYEWAVKKYLAVGESITREGGLQREIRLIVERAGGSMKLRDLQRKVHYDDYGTELWYRVYGGLLRSSILTETGTGKPGDPKTVKVLQPMLRDEDD
jgi:hypothetical protein